MEYLSHDIEPHYIDTQQRRLQNRVLARQMENHSKEIQRNHLQVVFFSIQRAMDRLLYSIFMKFTAYGTFAEADTFEML